MTRSDRLRRRKAWLRQADLPASLRVTAERAIVVSEIETGGDSWWHPTRLTPHCYWEQGVGHRVVTRVSTWPDLYNWLHEYGLARPADAGYAVLTGPASPVNHRQADHMVRVLPQGDPRRMQLVNVLSVGPCCLSLPVHYGAWSGKPDYTAIDRMTKPVGSVAELLTRTCWHLGLQWNSVLGEVEAEAHYLASRQSGQTVGSRHDRYMTYPLGQGLINLVNQWRNS